MFRLKILEADQISFRIEKKAMKERKRKADEISEQADAAAATEQAEREREDLARSALEEEERTAQKQRDAEEQQRLMEEAMIVVSDVEEAFDDTQDAVAGGAIGSPGMEDDYGFNFSQSAPAAKKKPAAAKKKEGERISKVVQTKTSAKPVSGRGGRQKGGKDEEEGAFIFDCLFILTP